MGGFIHWFSCVYYIKLYNNLTALLANNEDYRGPALSLVLQP